MAKDRAAAQREYRRKWREANREKHNAGCKAYRENNPEKVLEKNRKWKKENSEKVREQKAREYSRIKQRREEAAATKEAARTEKLERERPENITHNMRAARDSDDFMKKVRRALPGYLAPHDRDDVAGDIVLSLLQGEFRIDDLTREKAHEFVVAHRRLSRNLVSITGFEYRI